MIELDKGQVIYFLERHEYRRLVHFYYMERGKYKMNFEDFDAAIVMWNVVNRCNISDIENKVINYYKEKFEIKETFDNQGKFLSYI
jgi:hypothetical protein